MVTNTKTLSSEQREFLQKVYDSGLLDDFSTTKIFPQFIKGLDITDLIKKDRFYKFNIKTRIAEVISLQLHG